MSLNERQPIINEEGRDEYNRENEAPVKNWPRSKPILRHDISKDLPLEAQRLARLNLVHSFYMLFVLIINIFTAAIAFAVFETRGRLNCLLSIIFAPIWAIIAGIFTFGQYAYFYKAFARVSVYLYKMFFVGVVIELAISIIAGCGFRGSGFMGIGMAGEMKYHPWVVALCGIITALFFINAIIDIFLLAISTTRFIPLNKNAKVYIADIKDVQSRVGTTEALPNEVDGKKITYISPDEKPKVMNLLQLPVNSLTVISSWENAGEHQLYKYILRVHNEPERMYWSNAYVSNLIESGSVNRETQMLTISRLADGSFAFGVIERKQ